MGELRFSSTAPRDTPAVAHHVHPRRRYSADEAARELTDHVRNAESFQQAYERDGDSNRVRRTIRAHGRRRPRDTRARPTRRRVEYAPAEGAAVAQSRRGWRLRSPSRARPFAMRVRSRTRSSSCAGVIRRIAVPRVLGARLKDSDFRPPIETSLPTRRSRVPTCTAPAPSRARALRMPLASPDPSGARESSPPDPPRRTA